VSAGDTKGIDDVIERVQLIVEPVETVMYDVFDQTHAPQWRSLRARFFADNEEVKAATRELIDTSFRKLRSAEGAFELLQVRLPAATCVEGSLPHCMQAIRRSATGSAGVTAAAL
jgi:hypothetical protein